MHSSRTSMNGTMIGIYDRCEEIADQWKDLEASGAATPFQSHAFVSTLLETVGKAKGAVPRIVLVKDGSGKPQMILPLVLVENGGMTTLTAPDFKVADYFAPVIDRGFAEAMTPSRFLGLWQMIEELVGPFDVVELPKMPAEIEGVRNPLLALSTTIHEMAFATDLSEGFESYQKSRSKNLLKYLGRRRRGLERRGELSYSPARSKQEACDIIARVVEFKSKRYRDTGVKDLFDEPAYAAFYTKLAANQWDGLAHMAAISFNGEPISMSFNIRRGDWICMLLSAFDADRFPRESIGLLYLQDTLAWCADNHVRLLDFTWGDEAYKFSWENHRIALHRARYAATLRGRLHCSRINGIEWTRRRVKAALRTSPVMLENAKKLRKHINDAVARRGAKSGMADK
ncbi:GNAT family N-acetyltransferase [Fulvimarina sp. MAC3]|uniref:GNAT family N-acetyltransferase n=1 Tax=Fulvimarina sp. MAC3 TaxID=3148887 RepID=UPI0031FCB36D